jgi:TetR/AcrR family transcriptional regulator, fatty acid metabolism regulator protein
MQAKSRTATGSLCRQQIVRAATTVLARDGLSGTSFGAIAREAGLSSTGMVSYHFADKDDLLVTVVDSLLSSLVADVTTAMTRVPGPAERLAAYVAAAVAWQHRHRDGVRALWRLSSGWKAPGLTVAFDEGPLREPLQGVLSEGVATGVFRDLDPEWTSRTVLHAVEGFHEVVPSSSEDDADRYAAHVTALVAHGIRA